MLQKMKQILLLLTIMSFSYPAVSFSAKILDIYNKANLKKGEVWAVEISASDDNRTSYNFILGSWYDSKHHSRLEDMDSLKIDKIGYCMGKEDKCNGSDGDLKTCQFYDSTGRNYTHLEVFLLPNDNCYAVTH